MGFGGSAQSMITIIKNNKNILSKRKKFKRSPGGYTHNEKPEFDFPEATPQMLKEIRLRLKNERKQVLIKRFIVLIILVTALSYFFFKYF